MATRYVALDIETAGLRLEQPIIQLAAIAVGQDWKETDTFETKILFDEAQADPEALALNHYDAEAWKKAAISERSAVALFAAFLNKHKSVDLVSKRTGRPYSVARVGGHNVAFDVDRISAAFKRHATFFPIDFRSMLDTRYGAIWFFERPGMSSPPDFKLTTVAAHFGLGTDDAHDALADVRLSIAIARRLVA